MGYILRINELGDSEGNYSLIARDVLEEDSDQYGMFPVGVFRLNENLSALPVSLLIYLYILFVKILISMIVKSIFNRCSVFIMDYFCIDCIRRCLALLCDVMDTISNYFSFVDL